MNDFIVYYDKILYQIPGGFSCEQIIVTSSTNAAEVANDYKLSTRRMSKNMKRLMLLYRQKKHHIY
jgi:hypothetical protein